MTYPLPDDVKHLLYELDLQHVTGSNMAAHAYQNGSFFITLYIRPVLDHQWKPTGKTEMQIVLGFPYAVTDKRNIPLDNVVEDLKDVLRRWMYRVDNVLRTKRLRALIT